MTHVRDVVADCAAQGRAALVAFLPAAFPDPQRFAAAVHACVRGGADVLEIGIADEPPALEGNVVRAAFAAAAGHDTAVRHQCLAMAASVAPVIAMTHASSPRAAASFTELCADMGVGDALMPSVPLEQQLRLGAQTAVGVGAFVATREALEQVATAGMKPAFVYLQSSRQRTGQPLDASVAVMRLTDVRDVLRGTGIPVLVGFGIERPEDAALLGGAGADGVVVGSAVVRAAADSPDEVERLVAALSSALVEGVRRP